MKNDSEIEEKTLKQYIDALKRGGSLESITAKYNCLAQEWFLDIQYANKIYKLVKKAGGEKGFKSLDKLADRLQKWGAKELIIKL
jgi:hypothetical protein